MFIPFAVENSSLKTAPAVLNRHLLAEFKLRSSSTCPNPLLVRVALARFGIALVRALVVTGRRRYSLALETLQVC